MTLPKALCTDETGATGIEYGLIISLIAMALVGAFQELRAEVFAMYGHIEEQYAAAQD
ncbi:Flp family type IVb pilin [Aurantiacibacter zhengii]|uniref:Flp family type IVb pilin n=1 Tax=Aurantiacibacter zhengii TaxID=2307003 RepID=A0A418NWR3_9SPHN|nr:Flp family type IVb pilin [Aurantiacibacter zhengii]RIV89050.1 Flp family type IVb pilin [Aurantiacibacter zhengii]